MISKKLMLTSLITASSLYAGGYKIPEASLNAVALSAANIAHSNGADAAYYNPANLPFMSDESRMEFGLTYISLDATNFKGTTTYSSSTPLDIDAESETFIVPSIHYVSDEIGIVRFGLSIVSPGGLTKRWEKAPAKYTAEEFTLQVVEVNPSIAIPIGSKLAIAAGVRILHSSGIVKSTYSISRDMVGDSFDFGYNLALSFKPTSNFDMALTYRSDVSLTQEGTAKLYSPLGLAYDGGSTVSVPLPATLNFALAYTLPTRTTLECVYERNFWSSYKTLDFDYAGNIGNLSSSFDDPKNKDWKDVNALRIGITQKLGSMTLMLGAVYDETPVPDETVSFELPDSNSLSYSFGVRYQINKKLNIGLAALHSKRDAREVSNDDLSGEFSNSNVSLASAGIEYKF